MKLVSISSVVLCCAVFGCASSDSGTHPEASGAESAASHLDPADPSILRRPFTAEQIRDAWAPGLVIEVHMYGPEGDQHQRWTVLSADADGAEIEYATLDANGEPTGETNAERTTWVELRDHATFAAATSTVEETAMETALGNLAGWRYTTTDEATGTVSEYFFARDLPGAPIEYSMKRGEEIVMQMAQISRTPPG